MQKQPHYRRLEPNRFLTTYNDDFRTRADGTSWPRWRNTVKTAHRYHEALLSPGIRKNMQNLAKRVDVPEDRLEQFIRESPWDHSALQAHLCRSLPQEIKHREGALLLDDFGIEKKGKHSVAVQRQYSGTLGKTDNCQVAVNLVYVAPGKKHNGDQRTWPMGCEIYLGQAWANDPARRTEVRVPDEVIFRTKPQIAMELLQRARDQGVKCAFVGGDAGYGDNSDMRASLRQEEQPYVLGVNPSSLSVMDANTAVALPGSSGQSVPLPKGAHVELAKDAFPQADWEWVEWSQGTKQKLGGWFSCRNIRVVRESKATDEVACLLLEKRSDEKGEDEFKAYLCWGMDQASLKTMVKRAHLRWAIEHYHKEAKQLLGLDRFEGRTWQGWHHHVSMVMVAYAFLSMLRALNEGTQSKVPQGGGRAQYPSLREIAMKVEWELATQSLMSEHGLDRPAARAYAATILRRASDWFKPRK